jgi:alkylhydroperoxidase family enzyme
MTMLTSLCRIGLIWSAGVVACIAAEPADSVRSSDSVASPSSKAGGGLLQPALTRPEMKARIEALRSRTARLPLPAPSEEELASGRSLVNNGRMRSLYLPPSWQSFAIAGWGSGRRPRTASTAETLNRLQSSPDYGFKTRLFWIVSRANDCQYCLGHQELKLRRIGMTDDQIAALDSRWDLLLPEERPAVEFALKLTTRPHLIVPADVQRLQTGRSPTEVIDIIYTVARYNAVNRWTSATGIPQDQSFGGEEHAPLDTPTSTEFANATSQVAPRHGGERPDWEPWNQVVSQWESARTRTSTVDLPAVAVAQKVVATDTPGIVPPAWLRAISELPIAPEAWRQRQALARDGNTPPQLRAAIAWVTARENRAWYASAHARARFLALGGDEAQLESFAALTKSAAEPGHAEALQFARKLTSMPHQIEDEDIAGLRTHFSDAEVAELIQLTADANAFDRYTEALRLPLEF